jgi:hypothetical protein
MGYRAHFHATVPHPKAHRATEISSYRLANQGNAMRAQRLSRRHQVSFAHLHRAGGCQGGEHAGTAGQAGRHSVRTRTLGDHQLEQPGHGGLGELGRVTVAPGGIRRRTQRVREATHPGLGVVQENGHAAAEADRNQDVVGDAGAQVRDPDHELSLAGKGKGSVGVGLSFGYKVELNTLNLGAGFWNWLRRWGSWAWEVLDSVDEPLLL